MRHGRPRLAGRPRRILVPLIAALTIAGGLAWPAPAGAARVERCLLAPAPPGPDLDADPWLPTGFVPASIAREIRGFLEETGLGRMEEIRAKLARLGYDAGAFLDRDPAPHEAFPRRGSGTTASRRRFARAVQTFERERGLMILTPFTWYPAVFTWMVRQDGEGFLRHLDRALAERRVAPGEGNASPTATRRCPV